MHRIFALLTLVAISAKAQTDFIITSKADTLHGKVRIMSYDQMDRVQIEVNKKKQNFTALQVLTVGIDSQVYKPIQYEKKVYLMKQLKAGYLSFYAYRIESQSSYDGRFLVKLDGSKLDLPNLTFKKSMENFLEDCQPTAAKIKSGELTKKDVTKIIDDYNDCMKNQSTVTTPATPIVVVTDNESLQAIESLMKKVENEDFPSKKDALDILRDIQGKVTKNESVAKYLTEGLKSSLSTVPALSEDLNKVLGLLEK